MLNLKMKSSVLLFGVATLLGSCSITSKVADKATPGLMEGIYNFKSFEGKETAADIWKFDDKSYFEFKKYADGKYDRHTILPNGIWSMDRFTYENGNESSVLNEYVMEWHNAPFETLSSLRPGGGRIHSDNVSYFSMSPCSDSSLGDGWDNVYYVGCNIYSVNKHEFSKRKLEVVCRDMDGNIVFTVTFSNE